MTLPAIHHVTSQHLMSVNSTGPKILPLDDSVLKIDVFGTADGSFVDSRRTFYGTWAMLRIVILSVLLFSLLKGANIVWAILGRPPEETATSICQLNFNLKQRKDDRACNFRTSYLFDGDNIFRELGRSKNGRPPDQMHATLHLKNYLHFDEYGFDNRPASSLIDIMTDSDFSYCLLIIFTYFILNLDFSIFNGAGVRFDRCVRSHALELCFN